MTLGDLYDKLDDLRKAEEAVDKAELSIRHGGNASTMLCKESAISTAKEYVAILRNEEV